MRTADSPCDSPPRRVYLAALLLLLVSGGCSADGDPGPAEAGADEEAVVETSVQVEESEAPDGAVDTTVAAEVVVEEPAPPQRPLPSGPDVRGVDVSHHSGEVDWRQVVDAGYDFAYVKATEGVDAADPRFAEHWQALRDLGVPRGAYHFYVTEDDPEEQARFFLDTVSFEEGDLLPVVDVELIGHGTELSGLADRLRRFLDLVEAELGVRPMVYTMPNFWDAHLGSGFAEHPLWVAEYGVSEPRLPTDWDGWHLWQYAQDRAVPGVEKGADLSRLHPQADFRTLLFSPQEQVPVPAAPASPPEPASEPDPEP